MFNKWYKINVGCKILENILEINKSEVFCKNNFLLTSGTCIPQGIYRKSENKGFCQNLLFLHTGSFEAYDS